MSRLQAFLLVLIVLGLMPRHVFGQPAEDGNEDAVLGLSVGAIHSRLMDEAFSHDRIKYSGTNFALGLTVQKQRNAAFWEVSLWGNKGRVTTHDDRFGADLLHLNVSAALARKLLDYPVLGRDSRLFIGGQLSARNTLLLDVEVIEDGTVTFYYTGSLYLRQVTALNTTSEIRAELVLPVAGFVKRESYNGGINQRLESEYLDHPFALFFRRAGFTGLNPFSLPKVGLRYVRQLNDSTSFVIHYTFRYLKNRDIAPIRLYGNGVVVGIHFDL